MGKLLAYTRVSTAKQGEKGVSLQEQHDAIARYALQHGLEIAQWFEERQTAAKGGRPVFTQMLRLLRQKKADGVIMHKIDRGARNLKDWADLGELLDLGVQVHFANEGGLDLHSRGGRLSADIQAVVAADYIRNLREETKKGFYGRLKQGYYPISAPIGYVDQGKAKAKTLDPIAAPLVKTTFTLYSTSRYSLPDLAEEMYRRGLRNRRGNRVTVNGLSTMLNNPFYVGLMRIRKTKETFQGLHQPLVSMALFERVQAVLRGKVPDRQVQHLFAYSRIVRCGTCGYSLIGERQKGRVYYRCHKRAFKPQCPVTSIREADLDEVLEREIRKISLSEKEVVHARRWLAARQADAVELRAQTSRNLQMQLENIRNRLARLTDLLLDGTIDRRTFEDKHGEMLLEQTRLKQQLEGADKNNGQARQSVEKFVERLKSPLLLYILANEGEKRELVRELVSNLQATGKKIEITLKMPFRVVAAEHEITKGGPDRESCRTWDQILEEIYKFINENPAAPEGTA